MVVNVKDERKQPDHTGGEQAERGWRFRGAIREDSPGEAAFVHSPERTESTSCLLQSLLIYSLGRERRASAV